MIEKLMVPKTGVDVVLDTDAFNEIDDQFAIAYLLRSKEKLNTKAIYSAPFLNNKSDSPKDGMEYSPENPLYVVAIGAITNIASAILINPKIADNIVVVWLGGHSRHFMEFKDSDDIIFKEFNLKQDIAAARVVMKSGVAFVQLPCNGIVSEFKISKPELEYWLVGKNPLSTYLATNTITEAEEYAKGKPWTRTIWDVTAVAWLLNDESRFMNSRLVKIRLPEYDCKYSEKEEDSFMQYVYNIKRDELFEDLFNKLRSL